MADPILIVEDHKETLEAIKDLFRAEGYTVESAENGEAAIERITFKKYSLVLLDVMLPRVDGFEVCRRIRLDTKNKATPVIMLTALDISEIGKKSAECGANDLMIKPFQSDILIGKVKKLVGG
jgi:two-component system alkaline phosphatase synthesis response regulator PhoP